ncbi:hypothetical protein FLA_4587 [Filimonas lacunae]|nr:hypothetical protein FLA_4587 [Filimonas lacunae]
MIYLAEGVKVKLSHIEKDADGILATSKKNTTYQVLSANYKGQLPTRILSCLNNQITALFQKEKADYFDGTRSMRNYKKDLPIPFSNADIRHLEVMDNGDYSFSFFSLPLRTYLGSDTTDKKQLLYQLSQNHLTVRNSSIQLLNGKIFMLLTIEQPQEQHQLETGIIATASLATDAPITVSISADQYAIGSKEEFLYRKQAISTAITRMKKGASFNRSGHGIKRILKNVTHLQKAEQRYIQQKLHVYSGRLIQICIKHKAGILVLGKEPDNSTNELLLRNWGYGSLKDKIAYKAHKAGIQLIIATTNE